MRLHQLFRRGTTLRALGLTAVLLVAACAPLRAQFTTVSVSLPVVATLYMEVTGSLSFNSTPITATDFASGYRQSSTNLTVLHRGNVPHRVQVSASSGTLSFTPLSGRTDANPNRPASDLQLSIDGFATSVPLSSTGATLFTQSTTTGSGSRTVSARMLLGFPTTPPGRYSTTLTFTIVQN